MAVLHQLQHLPVSDLQFELLVVQLTVQLPGADFGRPEGEGAGSSSQGGQCGDGPHSCC